MHKLREQYKKEKNRDPDLSLGFWVGEYSEWLESRLINIQQAFEDNDNISDAEFMEIVEENTWDT